MAETSSSATAPSPGDLSIFRRRIIELDDLLSENCPGDKPADLSDFEEIFRQYGSDLEGRMNQILAESYVAASFAPEDSTQLKEELNAVESEKIKAIDQIELIMRSVAADYETFQHNVEWLKWSLDHTELLGLDKEKTTCMDCFHRENQLGSVEDTCQNFEILDLQSQMEEINKVLKSLENLYCESKRYEIIEQIGNALSGTKVLEFDVDTIRLSLKTYIPKFEGSQQKDEDSVEVNHELLIKFVDATLDLKGAEIFPDDIYIVDIVDAAKSLRQSLSQLSVPLTSLEGFLRKVKERIIITTLRQSVVRCANKLRYSLEYLGKDDTITAHFAVGVDAILKASKGWPLCDSPFELISLKYSTSVPKRIPLSLLHKVEEAMRSLDTQKRINLLGFIDVIEAMISGE